MQANDLRGFAEFRDLEPRLLAAVAAGAAGARRLRIPSGRWLVRPGRSLAGYFYLLDGRVRLLDAGRAAVVGAGSRRARRPIYPGASAVQTITACVFASVAEGALESVREGGGQGLGVPEVEPDAASWQGRFLMSPLMQRLEPAAWQRVLRAMTARAFAAGEGVVVAGEPADACFVLCAGRAEILTAAGATLASLEPGMLFGEDALITGGVRNAHVVMRSVGRAVSLPVDAFRRWLLDPVAEPLDAAGGRRLIGLEPGRADVVATLAVPTLRDAHRRLDRATRYGIVGGSLAERQLAAFLLAEQGFDAQPLRD